MSAENIAKLDCLRLVRPEGKSDGNCPVGARVPLSFCLWLRLFRPPARRARCLRTSQAPPLGYNRTPQQAYPLPPDKLAKAIALSRIRNIHGYCRVALGISSCLWLLLATRAAACGLRRVASGSLKPRWLQGLPFFAVLHRHPDPGQSAAGHVLATRSAALRHQRAGMGKLVWRSGQGAGPCSLFDRLADAAVLQLDRAQMAAALLVLASGWLRCR